MILGTENLARTLSKAGRSTTWTVSHNRSDGKLYPHVTRYNDTIDKSVVLEISSNVANLSSTKCIFRPGYSFDNCRSIFTLVPSSYPNIGTCKPTDEHKMVTNRRSFLVRIYTGHVCCLSNVIMPE
jgi:hypothetical protein